VSSDDNERQKNELLCQEMNFTASVIRNWK